MTGPEILDQVAERYRARGYTVQIRPTGESLPAFLGGHQPDLIARGPNESVIVEVKRGTRTAVGDRLRDLAERTKREQGWKLSLVFVDPDTSEIHEEESPPLTLVAERVRGATVLNNEGRKEAAFLLLWSALEGLLRILGARANLPLSSLPPSALIRELYSAGELGRDQYELLLQLLPERNRIVHGFGALDGVDVDSLRHLVEGLLAEASTTQV